MREIGSWTTSEGTVPATLDFESQDAGAQELPAWVTSAATGALTGALTGAPGGLPGALAGAALGGALGAAGSRTKPAPAPAAGGVPPAPGPSSPPPAPSAAGTGAAGSATVATALQQLAAILPVLLQTVAASGAAATKSAGESFEVAAEIGVDLEALEPSEWEFASLEGVRGIGEKFAANPGTGTGSMSVPIATSPGRSGCEETWEANE